jgi:hypothetical protein
VRGQHVRHLLGERALRCSARHPGVDFMNPFRPKFTDKTYFPKFKLVITNFCGFQVP